MQQQQRPLTSSLESPKKSAICPMASLALRLAKEVITAFLTSALVSLMALIRGSIASSDFVFPKAMAAALASNKPSAVIAAS